MWFLVVLGGYRRELFCQNAETVKQTMEIKDFIQQEDKINIGKVSLNEKLI